MPRNPDTAFFGHPAGLSTLFFTEMWERFSFYGMRALLILFMTAPIAAGGLGFDVAKAGAIYGTYTGMVYLLALPGGWLADRVLGLQKSVLWGGVLIMLGHISLAMPGLSSFYLGLVLVVLGTGLLKPNISALVGTLYSPDDVRRDAGFSIYYMGINLGAFLAPLVTGWFAQGETWPRVLESMGMSPQSSWHWGFAMAAVGMAAGLVQYVLGAKHLGTAGLHPALGNDPAAAAHERRRAWLALGVTVGALALVAMLASSGIITLNAVRVANALGVVILLVVVAFFAWLFLSSDWNPEERKRLVVILVLFLGASVFWSAFEQAGSTLNLFAERSTDNRMFGIAFPASWFQSANAFFIILLAPVAALIWVRLGTKDPSSPAKFALGLGFLSAGFGVMVVAAGLSQGGALVSPMWLLLAYLLHTIGELCLSPVGLSAMTRLAPARVTGLMMGVWFLATSVGNWIGGQIATFYEALSLPSLFGAITAFVGLAAVVMALLIVPIRRMMQRAG
ncbi:MAG TPA: peptide MFS transporter [Gemmatimonadales bacterium]|nr:peptide MFS transporter [Gemmatimonadales bacterium]